MRKLVTVLTTLLLLGGLSFAQNFEAQYEPTIQGAVRITNCAGFGSGNVDLTLVCNVSAFAEHVDGVGVFAQVSPRYGPFYENWQARIYSNKLSWDLGVAARIQQVGVTTGLELGEFFIRVESDVLLEFGF